MTKLAAGQGKIIKRNGLSNPYKFQELITQAKRRKCLVSGFPTDPNILGPTQTFF